MRSFIVVLFVSLALVGNLYAADKKHGAGHDTKHAVKHESPEEQNQCVGAGPQSPRDIDSTIGNNHVIFNAAPSIADMNLCNIHFHRNAEHKAAAYSTYVADGDNSGWACKEPAAGRLEEKHAEYNGCEGIAEGDTIEVHWVYTTCDINTDGVKPMGGGLNACMTNMCPNPELRVVAQVYLLEKNGKAKFSNSPIAHKDPTVVYTGSTTGTSWNNHHCSPLQVTWDVKTTCDTLDIDNFSKWCGDNKYHEKHAHGVRELVTSEKLLSKIK
ncbi:MAG: delta-class carbonic anhydrase [Nitrospirota bacterium]